MIAGQIEIQLLAEIVRLKKGLDEAQGLVDRAAKRMSAAAEFVRGALGGMAAGLTAGAFAALVKNAVDSADALDEMSSRIGVSVDQLSRLQLAYQMAGMDSAAMQSSLGKLQKEIAADNEALKQLGIRTRNTNGTLRDSTEVLYDIADAWAGAQDGTAETAAAMAIFGKSGAEMNGLLNMGSAGLRDMAHQAEQLGLALDSETAAAAARFNDQMDLLIGRATGLQRQMAFALLPALNDVAEVMLMLVGTTSSVGDGMDSATDRAREMSIAAQAVGVVMETLTTLGRNVAFVFQGIGRDLGGMAAQLVLLAQGDFSGARALHQAMIEDANAARAALEAQDAATVGATARMAEAASVAAQFGISQAEAAAETARLNGRLGQAAQAQLKYSAATKDGAKAQVDAGKKLLADAASRLQVLQQEIDGGEKLTDGQKFALAAMEAVRDGRVKLTDVEKRALVTVLELIQAKEKQVEVDALIAEAEIDAAKHGTKLAEAEAEKTEQVRQQLVAEQERIEKLQVSEAAMRARETTAMRTAAAELEFQAAVQGGNRELEERAQLLRQLADKRDAFDTAQLIKEAKDASVQAAQSAGDAWRSEFQDISQALANSLMEGGKSGADYVEGYLRAVLGREMEGLVARTLVSVTGGGSSGTSGGNFGGLLSSSNISALSGSYLSAVYGNGASAYAAAIGATSAGAGSQAAMLAAQTGEFGAAGLSATSGAAAGAGAGTASAFAAAVPIIGWIIAGIMASLEAYNGGANVDLLPDRMLVGDHERRKFDHLSKLGFSDKWANVLSGSSLVARTFGHKASASGFGIGTVSGGDFLQGASAPFKFGANTMGGGADPWLQDLAGDITASIGMSAGLFGGGLSDGMRFGMLTDRDRENEVATLAGFFDANNQLLAGAQTGSGAFGAGGPGRDASKIKAEDLEQWLAESMPVLILQGLQQSDLDARFETYFDSVGAAKLTPELAQQMLTTASAVAQLTAALVPIGGIFTQFEGMSVAAFEKLAKTAGGFEALGQNVGTYYQAFYSEAERTQDAWDGITQTLKEAGIDTVPGTRAELRALVDSLGELSTEADQKAFVALMKVAGAFDALTAASDAAAAQVMQERLGLEAQLLQLQGNVVELRRRERDALDETNRALYDQVQARTDANRIGDERTGLENQLLQLQGNVVELRRRERAQLDESNRALYDQVKALEDQQAAAEQAAQSWGAMQKNALDGVARAYQAAEQMVNSERQRLAGEAEAAIRDAEQKADASIRELESQAQQIERLFGGLLDGLADGIRRLSGELAGDDGRGQAMDVLRNGLAALQAGQTVDVDALRQAAGTASSMGPAGYASEFAYRRDVATTANLLRDISGATRGQRTAQLTAIAAQQVAIEEARDAQIAAITEARDRQLHSLDQQLLTARLAAETLIDINTGVQGVGGAIAQLTAAIAAAQRITGGAATPENTGKWVRSGDTEVWGAAGGAVAARPVGATVEGTLIRGLTSTFSQAEGMAWVNDRLGAGDIVGIYTRAKAEGIDSAALDAMMGWPAGTALRGALEAGLPAFETGTSYVPSTGLAVVHEGERIIRAQDNASLMEWMSGGGFGADACTQLAAEIRELRAEVAGMRTDNNAGHRANAEINTKSARALEGAALGTGALLVREAV
jgi:hypothetical protein